MAIYTTTLAFLQHPLAPLRSPSSLWSGPQKPKKSIGTLSTQPDVKFCPVNERLHPPIYQATAETKAGSASVQPAHGLQQTAISPLPMFPKTMPLRTPHAAQPKHATQFCSRDTVRQALPTLPQIASLLSATSLVAVGMATGMLLCGNAVVCAAAMACTAGVSCLMWMLMPVQQHDTEATTPTTARYAHSSSQTNDPQKSIKLRYNKLVRNYGDLEREAYEARMQLNKQTAALKEMLQSCESQHAETKTFLANEKTQVYLLTNARNRLALQLKSTTDDLQSVSQLQQAALVEIAQLEKKLNQKTLKHNALSELLTACRAEYASLRAYYENTETNLRKPKDIEDTGLISLKEKHDRFAETLKSQREACILIMQRLNEAKTHIWFLEQSSNTAHQRSAALASNSLNGSDVTAHVQNSANTPDSGPKDWVSTPRQPKTQPKREPQRDRMGRPLSPGRLQSEGMS